MSRSNFQPDEPDLIRRAQRGSRSAFNTLVLHYQDRVYTAAYRIMGEPASAADAAQETFITAFQRLAQYRGGSFGAWLVRIVTNHCYDVLRGERRRPAVSVDELPDADHDDGAPLPDPAATPEQIVQAHELRRAIQECINALSPDQRVTLVLCDVDGMDYAAIADATGTTLGTVKSRLSRARAGVRDCLRAVAELLPAAYRLERDE